MRVAAGKSLLVVAVLFAANSGLRADDKSLERRLYTEAPQGWLKLEAFSKSLAGRATETMETLGVEPPKRKRVHEYEFKTSGNFAIGTETSLVDGKPSGRQGTLIINDRYGALLARNALDAPWRLVRVVMSDQPLFKQLDDQRWEYGYPLVSPHYLLGKPLAQFILESRIVGSRVTSVEREEQKLVKFEFEYETPKDEKGGLLGGWVLLDPELHWAVREVELRVSWGRMTTQIDYASHTDGMPILKQIVTRSFGSGEQEGIEGRTTWDILELEHVELPASDFTLTAFGLAKLEPESKDEVTVLRKHDCVAEMSAASAQEHVVGTPSVLEVRIRNTGSKPVQIAGAEDLCTKAFCTLTEGLPVEVPAGSEVLLNVKILGTSAGPFEHEHVLYSDAVGQKRFTVQLKGSFTEPVK